MSKIRFDDENTCICLCGLKFPKEKVDDSCPNPLKNWESWLEKRRQIHKKLEKLGRKPCDLLMNAAEEYRSVKEDKLVLGYTSIVTNFDKLRGNPAFWKLPYALGHRNSTEYFAVRTKEDVNEIPMVEYIGTPNHILKEKGLMPRTRNLYTLWKNNNNYRKELMKRMSAKILEIEPHRPDLDLVLIGQKIEKPESPKEILPCPETKNKSPSITTADTTSTKNFEEQKKLERLSLKVNNLTFTKDFNSYCHNKISVLFEYILDTRVPCQKLLLIENTGKVVLRLYWKEYTRLKIFREYCIDSQIYHPFKFNRNEILLLPGEKLDFMIEFKTIKPGNYVESWELTTLPKIWSVDFHFVIVFKGFAYMKQYDEKANILIKDLNQRVRNRVIKDLLSDIISKGTYCNDNVTHSYDFSERELFESVNLKDDVYLRTPKYAYNDEIITELKEFYQEMKQPTDDEIWNLSIKKLKEMGRKKDLLMYFENNLATYETARRKRILLQDNAVEETTREAKLAIDQPIVKARNDLLELEGQAQSASYNSRLKDIIHRLEKPSIRENLERRKYFFSYIIIRTYIFKMFDHLYLLDDEGDQEQDLLIDEEITKDESNDQINKHQDIVTRSPKKNYYLQDRLVYEVFDEGYISRTKRVPSEFACGVAKPKTGLLRNISFLDAKKICKLYFNKDETTDKGQKKKTAGEDMATKKATPPKKAEKSKTQNQTEPDLLENVRVDYDPFIEGLPVDSKNEDNSITLDEKPRIKSPQQIEKYDDKYLFIYKSLCNAVDDLVETINSFKDQSIPSDTLHELRKCFTSTVKSDRDSDIQPKISISTDADDESFKEKRQSEVVKDEYFQFLLKTHWKNNLKTKKYFLDEKKQSTKSAHGPEDIVRVPSNIFSLEAFQRKPEPPGKKEKESQTTDIKFVNKLIYEKDPSMHRVSVDSESSKNIFYFLDYCDQEDE